jgi:hypothetical protein
MVQTFVATLLHRRKQRDKREIVVGPEWPSRLRQRSPSTVVEGDFEVLELVP